MASCTIPACELTVVVPAFNEEGNIEVLYQRLMGVLPACVGSFEILLVDDGSTDATADVAAGLHRQDSRVGLISLTRNFGHQAALMAGLDHARGRAVITMDADLQHPPELLPEMVARWRAGAVVVQTLRKDTGRTPFAKRLTSGAFYWLFKRLTSVAIVPGAADFFLLDRQAVDAINQCRESQRFTRGLLPWLGFQREFVPYVCGERYAGSTKYSLAKMVRFAIDGLFAFSVAPLRVAGVCGLLATGLGLAYLAYALTVRLMTSAAAPGWASLVGTVILMGGVQLTTLWCMGEYIARIAEQTRSRPPYLVGRMLQSEDAGHALQTGEGERR